MRTLITLTKEARTALENLLTQDMQPLTNKSAMISRLIAEETARRKALKAKQRGRPTKETETEEEPAIYDHPDQLMNKGRKITKSELLEYYRLRKEEPPADVLAKIQEHES